MDAVVQKLDMLAEFYFEKDSLDARKREMLDDVKVPAEVISVINDGSKRAQAYEDNQRKAIDKTREEIQSKLDAIKIPDEIRLAYEEIAHQRELITAFQYAKQREYQDALSAKRAEIQAEVEAQTAQVYADLAKRKQDIEAEFSGKLDAVDANIKRLEAEAKAAAMERAVEKLKSDPDAKDLSVKGKYFSLIYVRGKVSWNTDMLDGMLALVPQLAKARKEGNPSITLRKVS